MRHVANRLQPKTHGEGVVGAEEVVSVVGLVDGLQAAALHAQAQAVEHISPTHARVSDGHAVGGVSVVSGGLQVRGEGGVSAGGRGGGANGGLLTFSPPVACCLSSRRRWGTTVIFTMVGGRGGGAEGA